jgi:hypothetical protein
MRLSCGLMASLLALAVATPVWAESKSVVAQLRVTGEKDRAEVVVNGSFAIPVYSVHTLNDGKQVIVEVEGASLDSKGVQVEGTAALIVRTTASTTAKGARIVLDLTRAVPFEASGDRGRIRVQFGAKPAQKRAAAPAPAAAPEIRHVIIERRNGRDRLIAELSSPASFRVLPNREGAARLEITGASIAADAVRHLEGDSSSVIKSVDLVAGEGHALIEVERRAGAETTAIREGNRIVWLFAGDPEQKAKEA